MAARASVTHGSFDLERGDQVEATIPLLARSHDQEAPDPAQSDDDNLSRRCETRIEQKDRSSRVWAVVGLVILLGIAFCVLRLFFRPGPPVANTSVPGLNDILGRLLAKSPPRDVGDRYLQDAESPNLGIVPFSDAAYSPRYTPPPLEHTLSTDGWSRSCIELYVARGEVCPELEGHYAASGIQADVVWTWVNGSSAELLHEWMAQASHERGHRLKRSLAKRAGASVQRHFRDHDELRFSIRSVLAALPDTALSALRLIVGDTPAKISAPESASKLAHAREPTIINVADTVHFAQVPHWVELQSLQLPGGSDAVRGSNSSNAPFLRLHPHSTLFKTPSTEVSGAEARDWRQAHVPSFNSLAIESQIPSIAFEAPTALYLNDDFFLTKKLVSTDLASPLYGPVFRVQPDLLVSGTAPQDNHQDPDGEWKGLGYSAWLLDERFGARGRPYLQHIAKVMPTAILKEAQQIFIDELTETATARFRGDADEVQPLFLVTHYVIEKHREALLWSFLVARGDTDGSGTYSPEERRQLLASLVYPDSNSTRVIEVPRAVRHSNADAPQRNARVGLPHPLETQPMFTSQDGYAYTKFQQPPGRSRSLGAKPIWPVLTDRADGPGPVCKLDLESCFGADFLALEDGGDRPVDETFRRVAFEKPECGDCVIAVLVGRSGPRGLEAFLPPSEGGTPSRQTREEAETPSPFVIGLGTKKWRDWILEQPSPEHGSRRQQAAALIQRYAYTLGESPVSFYPIKFGGGALTHRLEEMTDPGREDRPAFVALNDDVNGMHRATLDDINVRLETWFEQTWPVPSPWEAKSRRLAT